MISTWTTLIQQTFFQDSLSLTLLIAAASGAVALLLGAVPAWLIHFHKLPFKRSLSYLAILPLALPSYVLAGAYAEIFGVDRISIFGVQWLTASLVLGASAAPFVFILSSLRIASLSAAIDDLTRQLGLKGWAKFFRVQLPLLRPTLIFCFLVSCAIAIGDYGVADRLGVVTLTALLHRFWFGFFDSDSAYGIAIILFSVGIMIAFFAISGIIFKSYVSRNPIRPPSSTGAGNPMPALWGVLTCILCVSPGFLVPAASIGYWATQNVGSINLTSVNSDVLGSVATAIGVCFLCVVAISGVIIWAINKQVEKSRVWFFSLSLITFLLPSQLVAYSVFRISNLVSGIFAADFLDTRFTLIVALSVKYFAVLALPTMDSLLRMPRSQIDLARVAGHSRLRILTHLIFPSLLPTTMVGLLLIFIISLNELDLSLILQPFGYHGVSLQVFKFAGLNLMKQAAVWNVVTLIVSAFPLYIILDWLDQGDQRA